MLAQNVHTGISDWARKSHTDIDTHVETLNKDVAGDLARTYVDQIYGY